MSSFWSEMLGKNDPAVMGAAFVFALLGILLTLLWGTTARDPNSPKSPLTFSWAYLFFDNAKRIVATLLMVVLSIRFMPELLGFELSSWHGFMLGIGWDGLAFLIKQKTKLLDPK